MKDLTGRTALVTGASRGLGQHIAVALAEEGVNVALSGRDTAALEEVAERVRALAVGAAVVPADLTDPAGLHTAVLTATDALGPIDILVNNAAIEIASSYSLLTAEELRTVIGVDLLAPMELTRLVVPGMLARGGGHVVNITSLAGKGALAFGVPYAAAKWGLAGFTHSLRLEHAATPVGFSLAILGFVTGDGMYARQQARGLKAPAQFGTVTPQRVAHAVIRAIRRDLPEVWVTGRPMRLFFALGAIAPGLAGRLAVGSGIVDYARTVAKLQGRVDAQAAPPRGVRDHSAAGAGAA